MKPRYVLTSATPNHYLFRDANVKTQAVYYLIARADFWRTP